MSEVSPCSQRLKSVGCMAKSAEKGNFQSHSLFFVQCLYFREGHHGPDWRPWRARSGPWAVVWRPLVYTVGLNTHYNELTASSMLANHILKQATLIIITTNY